jgi:hypothetical protein
MCNHFIYQILLPTVIFYSFFLIAGFVILLKIKIVGKFSYITPFERNLIFNGFYSCSFYILQLIVCIPHLEIMCCCL